MALRKQKAVFTAAPEQLKEIQVLVDRGFYQSSSEFLREAIDEKLAQLQRRRLADQVARYCGDGHVAEDDDLIAAQAFDEDP